MTPSDRSVDTTPVMTPPMKVWKSQEKKGGKRMENVKETVKFYYGLTTEQYKDVKEVIKKAEERNKIRTTMLLLINAVVLIMIAWQRERGKDA